MRRVRSLYCILLFALAACSHNEKTAGSQNDVRSVATSRGATATLSETEALARSRRLSQMNYQLWIDIATNPAQYSGQVTVEFDLKSALEPLTIDFDGGQITAVKLDGKTASLPIHNGFYLTFPSGYFREGMNKLTLEFNHPYSQDGSGFYRFHDPEDQRSYVYTDFEPYKANRLFPCFDQPDLKATYRLQVLAPKDWSVISSTLEESVIFKDAQKKLWTFPRSLRFSTYIFSLHAGPFDVFKSRFESIPLRLFVRKSLSKYLNSDEWFSTTRAGMAYYQRYFGVNYPFGKYDQVIVPDFNSGAMENVGAVTFSESYVRRGAATLEQKEDLANTILHEMAHMWFGDLTTMRWWNDLWLNESFATFMASQALTEVTPYKKAWQTVTLSEKPAAYWEDQLVTTHPIETAVGSTDEAFSNFDNITYAKGAAAIKQLRFLIGAEAFQQGVRRYFEKYAYQNATRLDFMNSLADSSQIDLSSWQSDWLMTSGVNTVQALAVCQNGKLQELRIRQLSPEGPSSVLRLQKSLIGLFKVNDNGVPMLQKAVPVTFRDTLVVSEGLPAVCPDLVFPNYQDMAYFKVELDIKSLQTVSQTIDKIRDPQLRGMLWNTLWDMVRGGQLAPQQLAELILKNIEDEPEFKVADHLIEILVGMDDHAPSLFYYLATDTPKARSYKVELTRRFEKLFWDHAHNAPRGSDFQKLWFDSFVKMARTPAAIAELESALDGPEFKGILDQDRRWHLIVELNRWGGKKAEALRARELARDKSTRGEEQSLVASVVTPNAAIKKEWFQKVSEDASIPLERVRNVARALFPLEQEELMAPFVDRFYETLTAAASSRSLEFVTAYAQGLAPIFCDPQSVERAGLFLRLYPQLPAPVLKSIKVDRQEQEKCLKVRAFSQKQFDSAN